MLYRANGVCTLSIWNHRAIENASDVPPILMKGTSKGNTVTISLQYPDKWQRPVCEISSMCGSCQPPHSGCYPSLTEAAVPIFTGEKKSKSQGHRNRMSCSENLMKWLFCGMKHHPDIFSNTFPYSIPEKEEGGGMIWINEEVTHGTYNVEQGMK